jgi:ketosteroid isomerase-like protein
MNAPADSPELAVELLDRAFNGGDLDAVLSFYEEGATVVASPANVLRGREQLVTFFEAALRSGAHAKQLRTQVFEADGIALFLSRWTLLPKNAAQDEIGQVFFATTVFRRHPDGSWKILIDNPFGPAALEGK